MQNTLRMGLDPLVGDWLTNFDNASDQAVARSLLDQLKLVSAREFETQITKQLLKLQSELGERIAVYPVRTPQAPGVIGNRQFYGSVIDDTAAPRDANRRRQYGSEDRVGHILQKLQNATMLPSGAALIECEPTITQLKTQGIKHVVLVDDLSGSGGRILKYWKKEMPKSIKSLLSLKKLNLWIVLYALTPAAQHAIHVALPHFPIDENLRSALAPSDFNRLLTPKMVDLCERYPRNTKIAGPLGYRNVFCPIVFEHGCPNNVPPILWVQVKNWRPLFPGQWVPQPLREYFDGGTQAREIEQLWDVNQPHLALSLINSIESGKGLTDEQRRLMIFLGMRLRGGGQDRILSRILLNADEREMLLRMADEYQLYDSVTQKVTRLGRDCVTVYAKKYRHRTPRVNVAKDPSLYYPPQCEGKFRKLA
ncbi:hypothetical protein JS562_06155 [Agrobacterium sp. S2]|nr:hypothetical protein [Agrobacterium sp. S2]